MTYISVQYKRENTDIASHVFGYILHGQLIVYFKGVKSMTDNIFLTNKVLLSKHYCGA